MDESNGAPRATDTSPADAARHVKETTAAAVDKTKHVTEQKLEEGAEKVATSAHNAASTLRRAADDVGDDNAWLGVALRKSAEGLESASTALSGGDLNRVMSDLNGFARRQPAVFLGASLAAGFMLARVGKTAIENVSDNAALSVPPTNGAAQYRSPEI